MKKIRQDSPEYLEALPKATEAYTAWIRSSPEILEAFGKANYSNRTNYNSKVKNGKTFEMLLTEKILLDSF